MRIDPEAVIRSILPLILILFIAASGCSSQKYITPLSMVRPDSIFQITDQEILEAFQSKPLNVAIYSAGTSAVGFADSLRQLDFVNSVYEVSPVLVEGDHYYAYRSQGWGPFYSPPTTDLKKLRLLAAHG